MEQKFWASALRSADVLTSTLLELLQAAAHMESEKYRQWALTRIGAAVAVDDAHWELAGASPGNVAGVHCGQEIAYCDHHGLAGPMVRLRFRRRDVPFREEERRELLALATQACAAWRMTAQLTLLRFPRGQARDMALADAHGRIHAVHGNFYHALRNSWPLWRDGALPTELRHCVRDGARLQMGQWRWVVEPAGPLLRVMAEPLGIVAALTPREQVVAAAVLECGSQKAAAMKLGLSNHTVRNTLARVYTKLEVNNRIELALLFRPTLVRHQVEQRNAAVIEPIDTELRA
jgi:DNA-binding CsgD family transcriptional regulator